MKVVLCCDTDWLLSEDAFMLYAPCMYHPTYEHFKVQMEDYLNEQSVKIYICENRGKKTGMMVLKYSGIAAEIVGIAVLDKARCQGIGKRMIQSVMESEGLKRMEAQTDDDSIGFYRKCGFAEERIVVDYPDGSVVRYNCVLSK